MRFSLLIRPGILVNLLACVALAAAEPVAQSAPPAKAPPIVKDARPPFMPQFGKLAEGAAAPEIDLQKLDGARLRFTDLLGGRVTVVGYWPGRTGPGEQYLATWKAWVGKYPDVNFVGLGTLASLDEVRNWAAKNAADHAGTIAVDPVGAPPMLAKPKEQLSDDEITAWRKQSAAYFTNTFSMKLGGVGAPVPTTLVFNASGKFVGWGAGGARLSEMLGNLLLRAGVQVRAEDTPATVWTNEQIAEATPKPEPRVAMLKVGANAPDFVSQTVDGRNVKLSDFRGQVVILDFWATWCGPCMAAMPHTQDVAARYKEQGVVVLANCTADARAKFETWVKSNRGRYPDIIWTHDAAERAPERVARAQFGVDGIPTQFILDREGRVVDIVIGYQQGEVLLDAALAKAGVKVPPEVLDLARRQHRTRGL